MKLPEMVKIGAVHFTVRSVDELRGSSDQRLDGWIRYGLCEIQLDANLTAERERQVLIHEIVHGIDDQIAGGMDEAQVERFANLLSAVLLDNPGLLEAFR